MRKHVIIIIISVVLNIVACSSKKGLILSPEVRGSAKSMYERGMNSIKKNPERARLIFKEVMQLYPDDIYAKRAKIGIADSYFRQKDTASLVIAASEYQEYVNLYPNSPDAAYAKFQVGNCYFKQMRGPERDQTNTFEAIKAFESLIRLYPDTEEAQKARENIKKARRTLAYHYFRIGYYNYKYKAFSGAIARFKQVINDYPEFELSDKLFFYTGKTYFKLREYESALSFFQKVINSYPESKYAKKSAKMVTEIERVKPKEGDKK